MGRLVRETLLNTDKPDTVFYALQIRRLAARHQAVEGLNKIKLLGDDIIQLIEKQHECDYDYYLRMENGLSFLEILMPTSLNFQFQNG